MIERILILFLMMILPLQADVKIPKQLNVELVLTNPSGQGFLTGYHTVTLSLENRGTRQVYWSETYSSTNFVQGQAAFECGTVSNPLEYTWFSDKDIQIGIVVDDLTKIYLPFIQVPYSHYSYYTYAADQIGDLSILYFDRSPIFDIS